MLNWINYDFEVLQYAIVLFTMFLLHQKFNLPYYIKKAFRMKLTKRVAMVDCFPCQSFWVALLFTFNPTIAMLVYLTAVIIDRKQS